MNWNVYENTLNVTSWRNFRHIHYNLSTHTLCYTICHMLLLLLNDIAILQSITTFRINDTLVSHLRNVRLTAAVEKFHNIQQTNNKWGLNHLWGKKVCVITFLPNDSTPLSNKHYELYHALSFPPLVFWILYFHKRSLNKEQKNCSSSSRSTV